jgi:hypothetical protein
MKAQIMVAEETLAIAQDAKVSHLQIQSNLQKTHQDCCIHDPFRKDIFCHNSRSWALEKDIKDKADRRATTQRYILQDIHQDLELGVVLRFSLTTVWLEISASNDDDATMRDLLELL